MGVYQAVDSVLPHVEWMAAVMVSVRASVNRRTL
jgi:hypothetical protein